VFFLLNGVENTADDLRRLIGALGDFLADMEVSAVVLFQLVLLADQVDQLHGQPHQAKEAVHAFLDLAEAHLNRRIAENLGHLVNGDLKVLIHILFHKGSPP
jgi:hypothetical protein